MDNFQWYSPWYFLLFLLFIPLFFRDISAKKVGAVLVPSIRNMKENVGIKWVFYILKSTKYLLLTFIILALARPRSYRLTLDKDESKSIDIMLAMDVSFSMFAKDFEPDRISVVKKIAVDFIKKRPNDRIGLVTYKMEAFPKVPLTFDHDVLIHEIEHINPEELINGTAAGEGLAVAVNHLKNSKAKSKIIILMTDGVSNIENVIPPLLAAEMAKNNNIKVYCIGIGTNGYALMPIGEDLFGELIYQEMPVTIDEPILQEIAYNTGGKYFRATSNTSLEQVYKDIDQLEKSSLKTNEVYHYQEYFRVFLWLAIGVLIVDALLRWTIFKILN